MDFQRLDIGDMRRPRPRLENRQLNVLDRRGKIPWHNLAPASHHSHIRFPDLIHTARLSPNIIPNPRTSTPTFVGTDSSGRGTYRDAQGRLKGTKK